MWLAFDIETYEEYLETKESENSIRSQIENNKVGIIKKT